VKHPANLLDGVVGLQDVDETANSEIQGAVSAEDQITGIGGSTG